MRPLAMPAVHLIKCSLPTHSHLGGAPALPIGVDWPEHEGRRLDFLAQLSLPELHATHSIDWLPATGTLLFFYDMDKQPWGFDPRDRGAARVLHLFEPLEAPHEASEHPEKAAAALPHQNLGFRRIDVFPSWERPCVASLRLSDDESDIFIDASDAAFDHKPRHQVGGYPSPIQGDGMELDCELVTHGLYLGDTAAYKSDTAAKLAAGADRWGLLLQLDTDDELSVMWGDCGRLYYWVDKEAARARDFSNAWLILQCG